MAKSTKKSIKNDLRNVIEFLTEEQAKKVIEFILKLREEERGSYEKQA